MESEDASNLTRVPTQADLVKIAREFNRLGVAYVVVGGFAINRLGFVRATDDLDLLIARDMANQALVKQALEILPDKAARELANDDLAQWIVVRVNDDITVDLMTSACGVTFEEVQGHIEPIEIDGVSIPFADATMMLRMKQGLRAKDVEDRTFLQQLLKSGLPPAAPPPRG
jgi:hypothetical protein